MNGARSPPPPYNALMRENDFVSWISNQMPTSPLVPIGIGDDMAAVSTGLSISNPAARPFVLLKIDQALDKVHFDSATHSPRQMGRKAVNRCLSDCAAMACRPRAILISVALPDTATEAFARELFLGARDAAAVFDCPVVGGDTAVWNQRLAITVAAMGVTGNQPVRRCGAKPGDIVCVSGLLGGSILGRHMGFTPRIALAQKLTEIADIHAMMDISDGLAMDFPRLMKASSCSGVIDAAKLPVHPDAHTLSQSDGQPAWRHALSDGEDYELLFTIPPSAAAGLVGVQSIQADVPITAIGKVSSEGPLKLLLPDGSTEDWPRGGWEYAGTGDAK